MQRIPEQVKSVLRKLEEAGHEAWCVGGCVRDLLLGRVPGDWDVTTSALPEETQELFGERAIPTGLQHGTVTVRTDEGHVEVTTYRTDGAYKDHRRPESVRFTRSLEEDLARRDFTVNAIAMSADGVICDPMDGWADLAVRRLRCVGDPDRRFSEDALRILRGLRFASVLEFSIESNTAAAIHRNSRLLREIAAERIRTELDKMLCGNGVAEILREYPDVLSVFVPEIWPAVGFQQNSPYHCYDVWEHTIQSVVAAPEEVVLRLTMLFHDLGKPATYSEDDDGGHFYGHTKVSTVLADGILSRLKYDNETRKAVITLVERHDLPVQPTEKSVGRALRLLGERNMRRLLAVKRADNRAQSPEYWWRCEEIDAVERVVEEVLESERCFSLKQLAVNGTDLMELGLRGRWIGEMLEWLLTSVVDGNLPNERNALMENAKIQRDRLK